jgi:hypothetical protein
VDNGVGYGPRVSLAYDSLPTNSTSEIVEFDMRDLQQRYHAACHLIKHDRHSRTPHAHGLRLRRLCMDLPPSSNGLVMVSGLESERSNIYTAPFTSQAWYAIADDSLHTEHQCYGMDARRVDQYTHAILTLTANMHRSRGVRAYILYIALGMLHLLIALYTANLTSAVLQEGRNNVKRSSCPSYRSVSEEGPSYRWGTSSSGPTRRFQPKPQRRLPSLMLWEEGEAWLMRSARFRERR